MNLPGAEDLMATVEATWPPASASRAGPWTIRDGQGGGKRVSAATANSPVGAGDLPEAEASMRALGQPELFMIRKGDEALDALLAQRGYKVIDPTDIYAAHVADLDLAPPPRLSVFSVWPPLAIQREVWATGGIGPGRVAVMERVSGPKTALLGRRSDRAVAAGFVAVDKGIAMIHALEVLPEYRRRGVARTLMSEAARWSSANGAAVLSLVVTQANAGAQALYTSQGFTLVGQYHYRIRSL